MKPVLEIFLVFLKLGLTSFGGPVAHIGYFRAEFVERRRWLEEARFADLVTLSQFLPGPASSKVGFGVGLQRAGWMGAFAAWAGFTLPSAAALILFAFGVSKWTGLANSSALHGLKLVAVAVVAQAVGGMARTLCPDRIRVILAIAAALISLGVQTGSGQILAIVMGMLVGRLAVRPSKVNTSAHESYGVSRRTGAVLLCVFVALLIGLPAIAARAEYSILSAVAAFYQVGSLVFGGGHVMLPLLQAAVVPAGLVSADTFLTGYGAVQAVPGPLFTFAAYLGAVMAAPLGGVAGGMILLVAIFVPGFLLFAGVMPFWEALRRRQSARQAIAGVNAAVVGILAAALYDPVWTSAVHSWKDLSLVLAAISLLVLIRLPPLVVIAATVLTAMAVA